MSLRHSGRGMSSRIRTFAASRVGRHVAVLLFYAALSVAISWPLARDFTTALTGGGLDALSHLWGVWHTAQAFAGREPLFSTDLLYYPTGASLLLHSAGPLTGVLAFPFWPLGPVAALQRRPARRPDAHRLRDVSPRTRPRRARAPPRIVAGIVLLTAPVHLVGLRGHLAKVFLGLMPLACLALRRASIPSDRRSGAAAFAATVLLLLLHSPFQFVQVALISPLFVLAAMARSDDAADRRPASAVGGGSPRSCRAPLLAAIASAAADPGDGDRSRARSRPRHQPDAVAVRAAAVVQRALRREDHGDSCGSGMHAGDRDRGGDTRRGAVAGCCGARLTPSTAGPWVAIAAPPSRSRSVRPCWCSAARGRPVDPP